LLNLAERRGRHTVHTYMVRSHDYDPKICTCPQRSALPFRSLD
jgi:hypothetical protein